jgi:hypothetical protein
MRRHTALTHSLFTFAALSFAAACGGPDDLGLADETEGEAEFADDAVTAPYSFHVTAALTARHGCATTLDCATGSGQFGESRVSVWVDGNATPTRSTWRPTSYPSEVSIGGRYASSIDRIEVEARTAAGAPSYLVWRALTVTTQRLGSGPMSRVFQLPELANHPACTSYVPRNNCTGNIWLRTTTDGTILEAQPRGLGAGVALTNTTTYDSRTGRCVAITPNSFEGCAFMAGDDLAASFVGNAKFILNVGARIQTP